MKKSNRPVTAEKRRKIECYLYTEGDVAEPSRTSKPFLAFIRDSNGRMHIKIMPPSKLTHGGRSRWRSPSSTRIKKLRSCAQLTQSQAAAISHSALRSWQDWESGRRLMHPAIFRVFAEACTGLGSHWAVTAEKLRALRAEARITELEAAALCHASPRTWRAWESGHEQMPRALYRLFYDNLEDEHPIASRPWG